MHQVPGTKGHLRRLCTPHGARTLHANLNSSLFFGEQAMCTAIVVTLHQTHT